MNLSEEEIAHQQQNEEVYNVTQVEGMLYKYVGTFHLNGPNTKHGTLNCVLSERSSARRATEAPPY